MSSLNSSYDSCRSSVSQNKKEEEFDVLLSDHEKTEQVKYDNRSSSISTGIKDSPPQVDMEDEVTNEIQNRFKNSNLAKSSIKDVDDIVGITLEEDTFTMMMVPNLKENLISYLLGVLCFVTQCSLISLVIIGEHHRNMPNRSTLDLPIMVPDTVRVGQFFALVLCLLNSSDIIGSIQNLTMLWFRKGVDGKPNWGKESSHDPEMYDTSMTSFENADKKHVLFEENRTRPKWLIQIFVPLIFKLIQGILVLMVSTLVIMRADNIIGLLKDYTALIVISEIDNAVFLLAKHGYLGSLIQDTADKLEEVEVEDQKIKMWNFGGGGETGEIFDVHSYCPWVTCALHASNLLPESHEIPGQYLSILPGIFYVAQWKELDD